MIVRKTLELDITSRRPLTPEQIAMIEARAPKDEDIVYDEDCPPMTEEQLAQFRPRYPQRLEQAL